MRAHQASHMTVDPTPVPVQIVAGCLFAASLQDSSPEKSTG